jgi:DNA mismatch repair protein MSH6
MDASKRKPEHPQYNPRTLYVPPAFLKNETAAMQQWWELKSQNMDTVLFFKVCSDVHYILYILHHTAAYAVY